MNRVSTLILKGAVVAIGVIVLALCIFALPAIWSAVPEEYPTHTYVFYYILLALYVAAVPYYVALFKAMKLLKYIEAKQAFSIYSARMLKHIAICAFTISAVFTSTIPFFYIWADNDDAPGLVLVNGFLVVAPLIIGVFSAVLQRLLKEAIEIKSENEFTV